MNEMVAPGRDEEADLFKQLLCQYDVPAYVRRAQQVREAWAQLLERCRRQRDEWLTFVRIRIGRLHALAGEWERLRPCLASDEQLSLLENSYRSLNPRLRAPVEVTSSTRELRRALQELQQSIEHFNQRWQQYLLEVDLARINQLRDGYNRYFLLEKECAVRSYRVARQGFQRLEPVTVKDLIAQFPPLSAIQLRQ